MAADLQKTWAYEKTGRRGWRNYAMSVAGIVTAALARWIVGKSIPDLPAFVTFYPVVFAAAILGGTRLGIVTMVLSLFTANVLFMEPVGWGGPTTTSQAVGMILFMVVNILISILAGRLRIKSEALQESQRRLQMAQEAANIGAFEWDVESDINNWTPQLERIYGLKPGEFHGTDFGWRQRVHPEDRTQAVVTVERALKTFQPEEGEWRVIWPDGSIHWLVGRFQAFKEYTGKVRLSGVNIDITDRKHAEQALQEGADRFRALVTASSYVVYRMSPDWTEMRELCGRNFIADTEMPSRTWLEKYIAPQDQPHVMEVINEAIRNKNLFELEHRVRRVDGTLGWTLSRAVPLQDQNGEIIEWLGTASDVTQRRESEQSVRDSEARLRNFIDSAPVAMAMLDKNMCHIAVSRQWLTSFDLSIDRVLGHNHYEVFPEIPERWKEIHRRCLAGATESAAEDIFDRADGRRQWVRWEIQPWYSALGVIGGIIIFSEDITERKKAEGALRESEERFRTMADTIPQLAWIARPDGYIFWFNRRCLDYTGATQAQLEGYAHVRTVFHDPHVLPRVTERWNSCLKTGEPFAMEFPLRGADGRYREFLTLVTPLKDQQGKVSLWFGTHTDITERKRAETEIIALRDRLTEDLKGMNRLQAVSNRLVQQDDLQTLLDVILDATIALTGADKGHIHLYDPVSGKLGLTANHGFGSKFAEYSSHIRPGVLASGLTLQTHQRVSVRDITTSPLYQGDPRALELILSAGMRAVVCTPLLTRSEQLLGTLSILFGVPHEPTERDLRLLDLLARQAADFIERTKSEEELWNAREQLAKANAELEQRVEERTAKLREAMAELEHMSYSMIHDMRAPLRAMQAFAQMLHEECEDCRHAPGSEYLSRIRESSNRLDRLITDALNYNKIVRETLPVIPVELGKLLRGILRSYPKLQPPAADVSLEVDELFVLGNESLLTQCFSSLLDNAVKFVAPGVHPRVRIWSESGNGSGTFDAETSTHQQDLVRVCVQDNGIGISRDVQGKIFNLFERMHSEREYPGTGVGLPVARKAVERMNGRICLDSEPGKGTCICVELPTPAAVPD